jgi:hypothetical protein
MSLLVPRYSSDTQIPFERLARGILNEDQFDDWLPDPIYYDDQLNETTQLLARVRSLFASPSIEDPKVEVLQLPRAGGATVPGLQLPIDVRVCAHAVIATAAPGLNRSLPRDKIYGFRFLETGSTVFDAPGAELDRVYDIVARVARAGMGSGFELLDVVSFNASARPEVLATTLQRCGARADEANFIRDCAALGRQGLPSVDDAFAHAYNFYLQPVDAQLVQRQHNFFRYRDEYFVFDDDAKEAVSTLLATLMLQARPVASSGDLQATIEKHLQELGPGPGRRGIRFTETLVSTPHGALVGTFTCTPDGKVFCTDEQELVFFRQQALENLFEMVPENLDAIRALPYLRRLHSLRRGAVLMAPPFSSAATELVAYRNELENGRSWLRRALEAGLNRRTSWQAGWAATLLSDLGPLTEAEVRLLVNVLASPLDESAKVQARIALARSSTLAADRFWVTTVPTTNYRLRAMLLAARHLSRRTMTPWNALTKAAAGREPELVRHLTANIRVAI